jgi:hypothetical protein
MPFPPKPYKLVCPQYQWSSVRAPKSDVLLPNDLRKECPECGCEKLKRVQPSMFEKLSAELLNKF